MSDFAEGILQGLKEAHDHAQGKIELRTSRYTFVPLPSFSADEIREIRVRTKTSQNVFALILGVSSKTVEAWESGANKPKGPSRRLLEMFRANPALIEDFYSIQ